MIIAIEGPDNAGKSTLVAEIRAAVPNARFVSMLGGRTEPENTIRRRVYDTLDMAQKPPAVLTERFHPISDKVYRTVFGGRRVFHDDAYDGIINRADDRTYAVVYCRPPLAIAMENALSMKGDDDQSWIIKVVGKLTQVFEEYDRVMFHLAWDKRITVVHYDFTSDIAPMIKDRICAALR